MRFTYTVCADCGVGEFLWRKVTGDPNSGRLGGNLYSLMDLGHVPPEMPVELFQDMCDWARFYMHHRVGGVVSMRDVDWVEFNQRGLALAQRLKNELGDAADVQYVSASEDPDWRIDAMRVLSSVAGDAEK